MVRNRIFIGVLFLFCVIEAFGLHYKENDYLVAKINCGTCGAAKMKYHEFTTANTQFLSKEEYRTSKWVQEKFTKNGVFDEALWTQFYDLLKEEWYRFCYYSYEKNTQIEINWSKTSIHKPLNIKIIECNGCMFWKEIK